MCKKWRTDEHEKLEKKLFKKFNTCKKIKKGK